MDSRYDFTIVFTYFLLLMYNFDCICDKHISDLRENCVFIGNILK